MEMSETSSNLSYMTSGAFAPKRRGLDVIKENEDQKDDEEESDSSLKGEVGDVQEDDEKGWEPVGQTLSGKGATSEETPFCITKER